jgi:hypothetical protein
VGSTGCRNQRRLSVNRIPYDAAFLRIGANYRSPLGQPEFALRNDGVGGSNPSCGTNKINNLVARAQIRELSCPPCVRKIDAAQA